MKFSDIIFKPHPYSGWKSRTFFPNGFELSVVAGESMYCSPRTNLPSPHDYESYEIAVFNSDGEFCTQEFCDDASDDVIGWQTVEEIESVMKRISEHA
jgi:hypothetical protein